jgi:membrane protein
MMMKENRALKFVGALYRAWITERPNQLAAALAYYGVFSIAPVIVIAYTIASLFIKQELTYGRLSLRLEAILGSEAVELIRKSIDLLSQRTFGGTTFVSIISVLALFFAASGLFFQIQFALNTIWKVPAPERDHTRAFLLQRLVSFLMTLGVGLLVLVTMVVNIAVSWLDALLRQYFSLDRSLALLDSFVLVGLLVLYLALIYKILPDTKVAWRDVWPGAIVTAALVLLAGAVLSFYFRIGGVGSAFEAAGAFAVFLLVIYYLAQIFLFGAVFTREYSIWFGSKKLGQ